jgi:uncharacterized membrane-anchored protein
MNGKLILTILLFCAINLNSNVADTSAAAAEKEIADLIKRDSEIKYQTGKVDLNDDITLDVPTGFKFMSKKDAEYVVYDYWGNPNTNDVLGMIVKENYSILNGDAWAFIVTYDMSGYVKDEDADKMDYDEMMEGIKDGEKEENEQRVKEGYPSIHMIGWATKPFYDKKTNILHWAKSMKFSNTEDTTLNYDVRILGRKGVLSLNAVGIVSQLREIQKNIPQIVNIAKFKKGSSYLDFDPSVDKVAAYTIGGLVAGKLLAKAGILVLLLKNIKLVIFAVLAFFGGFKNKIMDFFTKKKENDDFGTISDEFK